MTCHLYPAAFLTAIQNSSAGRCLSCDKFFFPCLLAPKRDNMTVSGTTDSVLRHTALITSAEDAIEMILAGANAVAIGTMNFHDPGTAAEVVGGIEAYMKQNQFHSISDMVGMVENKG